MVNINIGVLGHVDSGKTSLCKALSERGSTAAFDKHPQSRERGITIDLGFSTFSHTGPHGEMQFTLVDCPGHASLIKTVIGGAQIIDAMLLVVDATKGVQTQTAECLVIGEICCDLLIVVLNKVDLLEGGEAAVKKMRTKLLKTLEATKFKDSQIVSVSANPSNSTEGPRGIDELKDLLAKIIPIPQRSPDGPLVFCVDHCFQIKGQGTILTGTVIQGKVSVNSKVDIPVLKEQRKVKTLQVFRQPVEEAVQGDRVGMCVTQFDAAHFERGVVCSPNHLRLTYAVVIPAKRISYFRQNISSGSKLHMTAMHDTVLAKVTIFSSPSQGEFDLNGGQDYNFEDELPQDPGQRSWFVLAEFERPIICGLGGLLLASRLDTDVNAKQCRLAFYGNVVHAYFTGEYRSSGELSKIRVFKNKCKTGQVDRVPNDTEVVVKNLFKKETNIDLFTGMKVTFSSGETGTIQSAFGQSGKVKVQLDFGQEISPELARYRAKKGSESTKQDSEPVTLTLAFKKYVFDTNKRMVQ